MKKFISWVLLWTIILQITGCYSISEIDIINETELTYFENNDVKIRLFNGKTYKSEAHHHSQNLNNSDFIIGKGKKYTPKSFKFSPFEGKIYHTQIDSQIINGDTLDIWFKDKSSISMNRGDYFIFTSDIKKGVWLFEERNKIFINANDIKSVEVESLNILTTTGMVIGVSVVVFAFIFGRGMSSAFEDAQ